MIRYRGITWDHPRGVNALAAAARRLEQEDAAIRIEWDTQPLEGFESYPLEHLCARYDLVVLDHPHVGEAVARACLCSLEELFTDEAVAGWTRDTIGPCLGSYRYSGRHWALPLDAATQVTAVRGDYDGVRPETWDDVVALSSGVPVALSVAGPHSLLTFFSMTAALGEPAAEADAEVLVSREIGERVLDVMATLYGRTPRAAVGLNPIGLLETIAAGQEVVLCPLVYGYVNYATPAGRMGRCISFHDAPSLRKEGRPGSTLGGTGIGVSRKCRVTAELLEHLEWLLSAEAQVDFIPEHDGQPSRRDAWYDEGVNARHGDFFRRTARTLEGAYVRPRYDGYIRFQSEAAELLRRTLEERVPHATVLARLQECYTRSRRPGAER